MKISKFFNPYLQYIFIVTFLLSANFLQTFEKKPMLFVSKQNSSVNLNSSFISFSSIGHKRLISSLFWIFTILESDHEHYKKKDLNSWMYLRFKFISDLDPDFIQVYTFGGLYLSIIKDDIPGATELYKKGLKLFPRNPTLIKDAFFHFYFQVNDREFARDLLKKNLDLIKDQTLLLSLLARHETSEGNYELAFKLLLDRLKSTNESSPLYNKLKFSLYSIKAEKDLKCLNEIKNNCDLNDFNGDRYFQGKNGYEAKSTWSPFRAK